MNAANLDSPSATLADWLAHWFAHDVLVRRRPSTIKATRRAVHDLVRELGLIRLNELRVLHTAAAVATWSARKRSCGTIRKNLEVLRVAMRRAREGGLANDFDLFRLVLPPGPARPPRWWSPYDVARLLDTTRGHPLDAALALAVVLGLRRGEVLGLTWRHVSFEDRTLRVEQSRGDVTGGPWQTLPTKTPSSRRTLVMPLRIMEALTHLHALETTKASRAGSGVSLDDYVFTSRSRAPVSPSYLNWELLRRVRQLGLDRIRFHDLRHTAASSMLRLGISPRTVADILGHRHMNTTLEIYAHVCLDHKREAIARVDKALEHI